MLQASGPDETASSRFDAIVEAAERVWMEPTLPDEFSGRKSDKLNG